MATAGEIFQRKASGLVREGKPTDGILFNLVGGTLGPVIGWILLFGIPFYPGSNVLLTVVICFFLVFGQNVTYALFAAIMPRSGGDYVYVSRTFHPALGFAMNASFMFWITFYVGTAGALFGQLGLATALREFGQATGNLSVVSWGDWFYTSWGKFLAGLAVILIAGPIILVARNGLRAYFRFQRYIVLFCLATLLVAIVATAIMSHDAFVNSFNSYMHPFTGKGDSYQAILTAGGPHGSFSLNQTLLAMTWPFYMASFLIQSSYWAGEHRPGLRAHLTGMVVAFAIAFALTLLAVGVSINAYGTDFLNALGLVKPSDFGLSFTPYYVELVGTWTGPIVAIILAIGLGAWLIPYVPGLSIMVTRSMLAWSFDGIMPEWLGRVDERTHNPVNATIITYASAIFLLALYSFTSTLSVVTALLGFALTFFVACVAAIVFPYRRRDLFDKSPGAVRVAGVPLLTITGILGAVGLAFITVELIRDPSSGTNWPLNQGQIYAIIAAILVGFVLYGLSWLLRRRQGADITVAYRALPPE
jgi:basic amino acid/polyamine antiporter, APA family